MQNPEEIDKGSIEKSQCQAQTTRPGPGDPLEPSLQTGPLRTCSGAGCSNPRLPPSGLHWEGRTGGLKNVSGGCFTTLSLWFPSLSQMQIMRLNSGGSCVLGAGRGEGARSHRGLVSHGGHKGNRSPPSHTCQQAGRPTGGCTSRPGVPELFLPADSPREDPASWGQRLPVPRSSLVTLSWRSPGFPPPRALCYT